MLPTWQFMQDFCRMFKVIFVGMGVGRTCLPFQLDLVSMAHSIFFDMGEFRNAVSLIAFDKARSNSLCQGYVILRLVFHSFNSVLHQIGLSAATRFTRTCIGA
ncbi:hypothetical protein Peur_061932 [Populus x canadensis]|uniref:Uncharacterized protein n=1 Tax=Populus deltoides TaxID=3696 RepID=A0A8T2WJK8_POPDE|nr:hypothetical protein H0E87_030195 [Populus deltoides]